MSRERMFRVRWKAGIPFIQSGEVVPTGKKGRRVRFRGEEKLTELNHGSPTMKAAIEKEIAECSKAYGTDVLWMWRDKPALKNQPLEADPWHLVYCLAELNRLYKRLKKHHLVT